MIFTQNKGRGGFTIIELLVTISIMSILTIVLIPAMRSFDKNNSLMIAAEQLKSSLQMAQNYSRAPRYEDSNIRTYGVRFNNVNASTLSYEIGFWDRSIVKTEPEKYARPDNLEKWHLIYTKRLPKGVNIRTTCPNSVAGSNSFEISFMPPNGRVVVDQKLTADNKTTGAMCSQEYFAAYGTYSWKSDDGYFTYFELCREGKCKKVKVNSYTGQTMIK
jgi:prepilin-type N-terminal cleavage/methylation domain-containing protein